MYMLIYIYIYIYCPRVLILTASKRWNRPPVSGDIPGARDGHSACVIGDKMFVFGGFEEGVSNNCIHATVHNGDFSVFFWLFKYQKLLYVTSFLLTCLF